MRDLPKHRSTTISSSSTGIMIGSTSSASNGSSNYSYSNTTTGTITTGTSHGTQLLSKTHNTTSSSNTNGKNSNNNLLNRTHRTRMIMAFFVSFCCILTMSILTNQVRVVWRMMSVVVIQTSSPMPTTTTSTLGSTEYTTPQEQHQSIEGCSNIADRSSSSSSPEQWPPMSMIEAIWDISRSSSSSSTNTNSNNDNSRIHRRLIIAAANGQYADFAMNFAHSLLRHHNNPITNFVFVPLDTAAYTILSRQFPLHTLPVLPELNLDAFTVLSDTQDTDGGASFRSKAFEVLTSSRPIFLEYFLQQNITIFYNDIDMVWQYNAWDSIDRIKYRSDTITDTSNNNDKVSVLSQQQQQQQQGDDEYDVLLWKDGPVQICTCLLYMVPSTTAFQIIHEWKREIQTHLHPNDQKAFLIMAQKHHLLPSKLQQQQQQQQKSTKQQQDRTTIRIDPRKVRIFPNSEQYPTGAMYDWDEQIRQVQSQQHASATHYNTSEWKKYVPSVVVSGKHPVKKTNPNQAIIIHNNWIEGKHPKIQRFIQSQLWFVTGDDTNNHKNNQTTSTGSTTKSL